MLLELPSEAKANLNKHAIAYKRSETGQVNYYCGRGLVTLTQYRFKGEIFRKYNKGENREPVAQGKATLFAKDEQ